MEGTTPLVIEGVNLSRAHSIAIAAEHFRSVTINTEPSTAKLAETVRVELESAMVSLEIDSEPPGAAVRLNEKPVGLTPLTLPQVRADQRLRVDLVKPGFDIDQFVALPDKDGKRFFRKLVPLGKKNSAP